MELVARMILDFLFFCTLIFSFSPIGYFLNVFVWLWKIGYAFFKGESNDFVVLGFKLRWGSQIGALTVDSPLSRSG